MLPSPTRLLAALTAVLLALPLAGLTLLAGAPAEARGSGSRDATVGRAWPGHEDRRILTYRVHRNDTAAGIAKKFHAWTAELRGINDKSPRSTWYVGERVRVPVVVSRARADGHTLVDLAHGRFTARGQKQDRTQAPRATRTQVRKVIIRTAERHGVPPRVALAVAWHESGWQQQVRSPVGAIGVMQVMPGNRAWLSEMTGQRLRLKHLRDNVTAGVVLLKLLRLDGAAPRRYLSGYYQGQGSVEANGLYESTKHYIANVKAVQKRLGEGWRPDKG